VETWPTRALLIDCLGNGSEDRPAGGIRRTDQQVGSPKWLPTSGQGLWERRPKLERRSRSPTFGERVDAAREQERARQSDEPPIELRVAARGITSHNCDSDWWPRLMTVEIVTGAIILVIVILATYFLVMPHVPPGLFSQLL